MPEHRAERIRDIPTHCACEWQWSRLARGFQRLWRRPGCPWHLNPERPIGGQDV